MPSLVELELAVQTQQRQLKDLSSSFASSRESLEHLGQELAAIRVCLLCRGLVPPCMLQAQLRVQHGAATLVRALDLTQVRLALSSMAGRYSSSRIAVLSRGFAHLPLGARAPHADELCGRTAEAASTAPVEEDPATGKADRPRGPTGAASSPTPGLPLAAPEGGSGDALWKYDRTARLLDRLQSQPTEIRWTQPARNKGKPVSSSATGASSSSSADIGPALSVLLGGNRDVAECVRAERLGQTPHSVDIDEQDEDDCDDMPPVMDTRRDREYSDLPPLCHVRSMKCDDEDKDELEDLKGALPGASARRSELEKLERLEPPELESKEYAMPETVKGEIAAADHGDASDIPKDWSAPAHRKAGAAAKFETWAEKVLGRRQPSATVAGASVTAPSAREDAPRGRSTRDPTASGIFWCAEREDDDEEVGELEDEEVGELEDEEFQELEDEEVSELEDEDLEELEDEEPGEFEDEEVGELEPELEDDTNEDFEGDDGEHEDCGSRSVISIEDRSNASSEELDGDFIEEDSRLMAVLVGMTENEAKEQRLAKERRRMLELLRDLHRHPRGELGRCRSASMR